MIKEYRKLKGYTQQEMAEFLKLSDRQYQRIDNEKCLPRKDILINLFNLLDIPVKVQKEYIYHMWLQK